MVVEFMIAIVIAIETLESQEMGPQISDPSCLAPQITHLHAFWRGDLLINALCGVKGRWDVQLPLSWEGRL